MKQIDDIINDIEHPSSLFMGERRSFLLSLMGLVGYVVQQSPQNMEQKQTYVDNFISAHYPAEKAQMCRMWLTDILNEKCRYTPVAWSGIIAECATAISQYAQPEDRLKIVQFLIRMTRHFVDASPQVVTALKNVAMWLGIAPLAMIEIDTLNQYFWNNTNLWNH